MSAKKFFLAVLAAVLFFIANVTFANSVSGYGSSENICQVQLNPYEQKVIINGEIWIIVYSDGGEIISSYKQVSD